ncbi:MAG: cysteine dioxygenase family protein [Planctomycetes bacterium]|nr:cysteine dioxygenase family protein [Planctomycetota bacterium]
MDKTLVDKISLDEFTVEMMKIPQDQLKVKQLVDLFGRLTIDENLIKDQILFKSDDYTRNLISRTPYFDLLVLCWKPGHVTTIHDHAGSLNVTRVYTGKVTQRLFEVKDKPSVNKAFVKQTLEEAVETNLLACVDYDEIHQLANTSTRELVTIHLYAKPLKNMTTYCPNTGEVGLMNLRYTLEDSCSSS